MKEFDTDRIPDESLFGKPDLSHYVLLVIYADYILVAKEMTGG